MKWCCGDSTLCCPYAAPLFVDALFSLSGAFLEFDKLIHNSLWVPLQQKPLCPLVGYFCEPDTLVVWQGLSQNLREGFSLGGMSQVLFLLSAMLDWTFLSNHVSLVDMVPSNDSCLVYLSGLFGWGLQVTRVTSGIWWPRVFNPGQIPLPLPYFDW